MLEPASDAGQPARVLAKLLVEAIEAKVRTGISYAAIAREAKMTPQQLANLKAAVAKRPDHVIDSDVAERLAGAIGLRVALLPKEEPAAPEKGGRS